jgi:hypothetical protein
VRLSNDIEVRLSDKRLRAFERFQIIQDVASVAALVPAAIARSHATDPLMRGLAWVEFAAVAVLVVATIQELRDGDDDITGISWTNIIVGALIITESLVQTHEGAKLGRPALLAGISSVVLGFFQNHLRKRRAGRRSIRITDEGIAIRLGKFRRFERPWSEIERIEDRGDTIVVIPTSGRARRVNLKRYDNSDEIRAAFADCRTRVISSGRRE